MMFFNNWVENFEGSKSSEESETNEEESKTFSLTLYEAHKSINSIENFYFEFRSEKWIWARL